MSDGMRRPPRLWEQKLEAKIKASGIGAGATSGGTSPIVGAPTPGPGGPGESLDPVPIVEPDPSTPRLPATPSVFAAIGGLSVIWTGLDADGDPFPTGTSVQVHVSTSTGFTPDGTTLRGVLRATERLVVTGLTSGTTYYVKFVLVAPDGTEGETSAQQSATAGFVLSTNIGTGEISADLVNFNAAAIGGIQQFVGSATPTTTAAEGSTWINTSNGSYYTLTGGSWVQRQWNTAAIATGAINTLQIATGAITANSGIIANLAVGNAQIADLSASKLTAGTIDASVITVSNLNASNITTGSLSGDRITGGTITGTIVQTSSGANRIVLKSDQLEFFGSGSSRFNVTTAFNVDLNAWVASFSGGIDIGSGGLYVAGAAVDMPGVYNNNTTGIDSVGINPSNRLRRISSSQAIKYDMATLSGTLSDSVDADRQLGVATVDPEDVLDLAVTEFSVIDDGEPTDRRVLGFIADDVADKFPIAATRDADGNPAGVLDTAILAGLLAVVKQQQQTIDNLTARIEALEA